MSNKKTFLKVFIWITPFLLLGALIFSIIGFKSGWVSNYNGIKIESYKPMMSSAGAIAMTIVGIIVYGFVFLKPVQNLEKLFLWMVIVSFVLGISALSLGLYGKFALPEFRVYFNDGSYFHGKMTAFKTAQEMIAEINKTPNHRVPAAIIMNLIDAGILS